MRPGPRDRPAALLIDLDGVVRNFDPAVLASIEERAGLAAGAVLTSAFAWDRLRPALVGEWTDDEWRRAVVADLASVVPPSAAESAVREWQAYRGEASAPVLAFVREVRAAGIPVGLTTNATSRLDADLSALGLAGEFDAVVNSWAVGIHKPAREYFAAACTAVAMPPARCLLVDDDDRNVRGARAFGLSAFRWSGPGDLPYLRTALALPPDR